MKDFNRRSFWDSSKSSSKSFKDSSKYFLPSFCGICLCIFVAPIPFGTSIPPIKFDVFYLFSFFTFLTALTPKVPSGNPPEIYSRNPPKDASSNSSGAANGNPPRVTTANSPEVPSGSPPDIPYKHLSRVISGISSKKSALFLVGILLKFLVAASVLSRNSGMGGQTTHLKFGHRSFILVEQETIQMSLKRCTKKVKSKTTGICDYTMLEA